MSLPAPDPQGHERTVAAMLACLSAGDVHGALDLFTDDVEMDVAFQPEGAGFWSHTSGKPALARFLGSLPTLFDDFAIGLTAVYELADPDGLIVRYRSDATVRRTGRPYRNSYIAIFAFAPDGRMREWTEFHNPLVLLEAFRTEQATDVTGV